MSGQVVWCDFGEHAYTRELSRQIPPYACPQCAKKLPTEDELKALNRLEALRGARLRATASSFAGLYCSAVVCMSCERLIALPLDNKPVCRECRLCVVTDERRLFPNEIPMGTPFAAAREIGMHITDEDTRWLERRVGRPSRSVEEMLWCEAGGHTWSRVRTAGTPPRSCSEHERVEPARAAEWPGDDASCFLGPEGWSIRLFVNGALLRGSRWHIPSPIARTLELNGERPLAPAERTMVHDLVVSQTARRASAAGIASALSELDAVEGDFVFVTLGPRSWSAFVRKHRELARDDALGYLLWSCGMDPSDSDARKDPWRHVGRTLGGGADRESVRARLLKRRNIELVSVIDDVAAEHRVRIESWPVRWQFSSPMLDDPRWLALDGGSAGTRVALGVSTGGDSETGLVLGPGNVVWVQVSSLDVDLVESLLAALPYSVIPAATNPRWVRWMRAEHRARRSALSGNAWVIEVDGREWRIGDSSFTDLLDALEHVPEAQAGVRADSGTVVSAYPRSGFAFDRLAKRSVMNGCRALKGSPTSGFVAIFARKSEATGLSIPDVLGA